MKLPMRAVLTDMNQPLGYAVGNSLEVIEAIEILRGERCKDLGFLRDVNSADLKELTIQLCCHMLELGGLTRKPSDARRLTQLKLKDGSAWKIFQELVKAQ